MTIIESLTINSVLARASIHSMTNSSLGSSLQVSRVGLPIFTGALYSFGLWSGSYNLLDPVNGARYFGIVLPGTQPTPTEAAYTRIHGVRNVSNAIIGLGMVAYLQFSKTCKDLPFGPFAAAAMRKALGYSMLVNGLVTFLDGYIMKQFSDSEKLSDEAVETAKNRRLSHMAPGLPITLLGLGWIYA